MTGRGGARKMAILRSEGLPGDARTVCQPLLAALPRQRAAQPPGAVIRRGLFRLSCGTERAFQEARGVEESALREQGVDGQFLEGAKP